MYLIVGIVMAIAIGHKAQTQKGRTGLWWGIGTAILICILGTVIGAAMTSSGRGAILNTDSGNLTWMIMAFGGAYAAMWLIVESLPTPAGWKPSRWRETNK